MRRRRSQLFTLACLLLTEVWLPGMHALADSTDAALVSSAYRTTEHNVGRLAFSLNNNGGFGGMASLSGYRDYFTGRPVRDGEYPIGSGQSFIGFGGLWVGAVVGNDTLVSTTFNSPAYQKNGQNQPAVELFEFQPGGDGEESLQKRSTLAHDSGAVSHQDIQAIYADTCTTCFPQTIDWKDNRPHRPLGVEVRQQSYAWTYPWADAVILIAYTIKNVSTSQLSNLFAGIYVDGDVVNREYAPLRYTDDMTGIRWVTTNSSSCLAGDSILIAWIADNDGDDSTCGGMYTLPHALAVSVLQADGGAGLRSCNWWVTGSNGDDFGPRRRSTGSEPYRDFGTGNTGVPYGDKTKYYMLRHREFDHSQYYTKAIATNDSLWSYVPDRNLASRVTVGGDIRVLLSVGPWQLAPGEEASFAAAFIGGESLFTSCGIPTGLPDQPAAYVARLNFSSLDDNTGIASRILDVPGVDSDSDGYAGTFIVCDAETTWTGGDGRPDYLADVPPVPPIVSANPIDGGFRVRWNGGPSELRPDPISRRADFEEYQVLLGADSASEFTVIATWDLDDYVKEVWHPSTGSWWSDNLRLSGDSLRCLYAPQGCADSDWDAASFTRMLPLHHPQYSDSIFAFAPIGRNAKLGETTAIRKRFPDAPRPAYARPSLVPPESTQVYLTDAGLFRYYEYEMYRVGLPEGETCYVAVTAADIAFPGLNEQPRVSSPSATVRPVAVPIRLCCAETVGNVDCDEFDVTDIADLAALVNNLFVEFSPPCCYREANCDGIPGIDIGDLSALINHLFISGAPLPTCASE